MKKLAILILTAVFSFCAFAEQQKITVKDDTYGDIQLFYDNEERRSSNELLGIFMTGDMTLTQRQEYDGYFTLDSIAASDMKLVWKKVYTICLLYRCCFVEDDDGIHAVLLDNYKYTDDGHKSVLYVFE